MATGILFWRVDPLRTLRQICVGHPHLWTRPAWRTNGEKEEKRGVKSLEFILTNSGMEILVHVSEWLNFDLVYIAQGIVPFMTSGQNWNFGMLSGSNQFGKRYPLKSNIDIDTQDSYV